MLTRAERPSALAALQATVRHGSPAALAVLIAVTWPTWIRDWHYLDDGLQGGLHFYALHPRVQVGPIALLISGILPQVVGAALTAALLPVGLRLVEGIAARRLPLAAGLLAAVPWGFVVSSGHLEDALAITLVLAACRWPRHFGLLLGIATGVKPWAVIFLPLARDRRQLATALVILTATWAPFLLASRDTWTAVEVQYEVTASSPLRLIGLSDAPPWWRIAQLLICMGLVALARRSALPTVLFIGVATRIALDPGAWPYFVGPLAVVAAGGRRPILATGLALGVMFTMSEVGNHDAVAVTRLLLLGLGAVAVAGQFRLPVGDRYRARRRPTAPGVASTEIASSRPGTG